MEPKDIIYNKWIKCSDDNYWQSEHDIVLCPIDGEVYMFTKSECPYGWNVLVDIEAQFFTVEYPKEIKEYMRERESGKVDFYDCYTEDYIFDKIKTHVCDYIDYSAKPNKLSYDDMRKHFRFADFIKGEFDRDIEDFTEDSLETLEEGCLEIAGSYIKYGVSAIC